MMPNHDVARYFALSQPKLRAFIRSVVFNPSDVDDILQDVVVIAIESSDRYDPNRSVDGWVFGIARNRIAKYFEQKKRQNLRFSGEFMDAFAEATQVDDAEQYSLDALEACLAKLEPEKRELLVKRHHPGTTARQLAIEIGYTDTRMSRLINSLYTRLLKCIHQELTVDMK